MMTFGVKMVDFVLNMMDFIRIMMIDLQLDEESRN